MGVGDKREKGSVVAISALSSNKQTTRRDKMGNLMARVTPRFIVYYQNHPQLFGKNLQSQNPKSFVFVYQQCEYT